MSEEDIEAGKRADRAAKDAYFGRRARKQEASVSPSFASLFDSDQVEPSPGNGETPPPKKKGIRERLKQKLHIGEKRSE